MRYTKAKKKVLSIHGMYSEQVDALHSDTTAGAAKLAESKVLKWADKLTTDSKFVQKQYKEKTLLDKKIRVHVDKRNELTPGFKFHDWELKGIPIRIEIGPKDVAKNQVVLARRYNQTKTNIASDDKMSNIAPTVQKELDDIQKQMFVAAEKILDNRIVKVSQFDQFKEE